MTKIELERRMRRSVILVVADFGQDTGEVRRIATLGGRVEAAGLGGEAERALLASLGIDAEGVVEAREAVLAAALDRLGAADAVLFGAGEWTHEREEIFDAEREQAIADGRSLRPLISRAEAADAFLKSAEEAAAFALARAAGADGESAKKFVLRVRDREQELGHQDKDRKPGAGGLGRPTGARRRKAG